MLKKAGKYIEEPWRIILLMQNKGMGKLIPDKLFIKALFRITHDFALDLKAPKTFNEKISWLKLYNRKDEYTDLVDKIKVKKYISDTIGAEHVIPTIGVWNNEKDIDFSTLPEKFVLKCNHDSGSVVICKDRAAFDEEKARDKLGRCLRTDYYMKGREWPYKNVERKILAEPYFEDLASDELRDYKFYCFDGKVMAFHVDTDRFVGHKRSYYDRNKNLMPFTKVGLASGGEDARFLPETIDQMIKYAEKLCGDMSFVRVDFYSVGAAVYFGELTFFPEAGTGRFTDTKYEKIWGDWLQLPPKCRIK